MDETASGHKRLSSSGKELEVKEIVLLLVVIGAWYLLQAYILPKLGVST